MWVIKVAYPLAFNLANVGRAGIRDGNDLDQLGLLNGGCLVGSENGPQVDAPVGSQPDQALNSDDGAHPYKRPFFAADVLVVSLGREVDGQKGGPHDRKGPDVGMEEEGPRGQKLRRLDLRIFHEPRWRRRHGRWSRATARCQDSTSCG